MSSKHKCPRLITPSKYETQGKDSFNWWLRLFKKMEDEFQIPPHLRRDVISKIFPEKLLQKILTIITTVDPKQDSSTDASYFRRVSDDKISKSDRTILSKTERSRSLIDEEDKGERKYKLSGRTNPYLKFCKCPPERAAIWRPLPPLSIEGMDLNQKSEAITEAIAVDFVAWLMNLGGETKTTLDVAQVMKMFEVGFHTHAATSLVVRVKEMPAVPKYVAEMRKHPEKAFAEKLKEQIYEDIRASQKTAKARAFYTTLPNHLRYTPPKQGIVDKWLTRRAPERIASMAIVWEGITHLRSTRAFCKWLIEHPDVPRPQYLIQQGMLESSYFEKPHYSIDSQLSTQMIEPGFVSSINHIHATPH
ncbi:hypothetical protein PPYR_07563 [Photinus pyralis]|uniref:Uncharacterized protein n=2 Tax=Photinus pyralis TaxID=7054 RepID=A0A5N4AQY9_PHOPY|nr:uncharacterized protein LOC116169119 [Photinus pyralis]KAB0799683.1 hypothetical protein PPYR_07563 [Photinus pyralis]